jgi:hypothetical protein
VVAAIVIPIICAYFFWITRKEMKEYDKKWLAVGDVRKEAIVTGEIKSITEEKQRFYYNRHLFVQTLKLQSGTKIFTAQKAAPMTKNMKKALFHTGDIIRVYGTWKGSIFIFNDYEVKSANKLT